MSSRPGFVNRPARAEPQVSALKKSSSVEIWRVPKATTAYADKAQAIAPRYRIGTNMALYKHKPRAYHRPGTLSVTREGSMRKPGCSLAMEC